MTEFRNVQADLTRFRARILAITVMMLVLFALFAMLRFIVYAVPYDWLKWVCSKDRHWFGW